MPRRYFIQGVGMLRFSDGEEFDTSGEPRIERRSDGLYVCGDGMLIPVRNLDEALLVIENMEDK
jgi:hypothetical protein